jgi:hypothetical protein
MSLENAIRMAADPLWFPGKPDTAATPMPVADPVATKAAVERFEAIARAERQKAIDESWKEAALAAKGRAKMPDIGHGWDEVLQTANDENKFKRRV